MKTIILAFIPAIAFAAPANLENIQKETYNRVIVANTWYANDWHVAKKGEVYWGNCSSHAATAKSILEENGYTANYVWCNRGRHVFTASQGYAFDARFRDRIVSVKSALDACEK